MFNVQVPHVPTCNSRCTLQQTIRNMNCGQSHHVMLRDVCCRGWWVRWPWKGKQLRAKFCPCFERMMNGKRNCTTCQATAWNAPVPLSTFPLERNCHCLGTSHGCHFYAMIRQKKCILVSTYFDTSIPSIHRPLKKLKEMNWYWYYGRMNAVSMR